MCDNYVSVISSVACRPTSQENVRSAVTIYHKNGSRHIDRCKKRRSKHADSGRASASPDEGTPATSDTDDARSSFAAQERTDHHVSEDEQEGECTPAASRGRPPVITNGRRSVNVEQPTISASATNSRTKKAQPKASSKRPTNKPTYRPTPIQRLRSTSGQDVNSASRLADMGNGYLFLSDQIRDAAECMLRRTGATTVPDMMIFLEERFEDLPSGLRVPIILATFAAARKVAVYHLDIIMKVGGTRQEQAEEVMLTYLHGLSGVEPDFYARVMDQAVPTPSVQKTAAAPRKAHQAVEKYCPLSNFLTEKEVRYQCHLPGSMIRRSKMHCSRP